MHEVFSFFKEKKVLITGHTGFKGSWLTLWLVKLGAKVLGYSLEPPTQPNLFNTLNLEKKIIHVLGDVRDFAKVLQVFQNFQPEIVFHLASQPIVSISYKQPYLTFETNIMGTLNVLEAIRNTKSVKSALIITTDKCYENKEWIYGYREIDPLGGKDPYSASKACMEHLVFSYNKSFKLPLASVRSGNVIGGGDWQVDRLVPDCIKAFLKEEPVKIRNPEAIRPWQYVLEPLFGYLLLAKKIWKEPENYCEPWNFGPFEKDLAKVKEVVEKLIQLWGKGSYKITKKEFSETNLLRLDISKTLLKLGWSPKLDLDTALQKTIDWYKTFYQKKEDMLLYSLKEIEEYEEKCL